MNRFASYSPLSFSLVKPLIIANLITIGVLLDVISSKIGWSLGLAEGGNALFLFEFIALLCLALAFYRVKKPLAVIPVFFAFLPAINNLLVIGGIM